MFPSGWLDMSKTEPDTTTDVAAPDGKFSRDMTPVFVPVILTMAPDRPKAVFPRTWTSEQFATPARFCPPRAVLQETRPLDALVRDTDAVYCPANALPSTMKSEVMAKVTWTPASVVVASPKLFPVTATRLQLARETLGLYEDVFLEPMSDP